MSNWEIPGTGYALTNIHAENARCRVGGCMIHNPTKDSIMNIEEWPYQWRSDKSMMERQCKHSIGHPDYDNARFLRATGHEEFLVHGCDGCCREVVLGD